MKTEIYERLKTLHNKYGPQEFGKICQKFLAIAFQEAGYSCVAESERGVQGVDIGEVERGDEKYSIEVKTTITAHINYEQKDEEGLIYKKRQGYQPVLAVLKLDRFSHWLFARSDKLKAGRISIISLRAYRLDNLEGEISRYFDEAVKEHYENTLEGGQNYLDTVLRQIRNKGNKS